MSVLAVASAAVVAVQLVVLLAGWCALCRSCDRQQTNPPPQPEPLPLSPPLLSLSWIADRPVYRVERGDPFAVALWLHRARDEGTMLNGR